MGILGNCRARMIVESCKNGDCSMDFGKMGGMSTATLSQRRGLGDEQNGQGGQKNGKEGTIRKFKRAQRSNFIII